MLVYQNSVAGFLEDVDLNRIDTQVQQMVLQRLNMRVSESELRSWGNSLTRVAGPLRAAHVAMDATVSIECQLPMSSKRIDFIVSGFGEDDEPQVVIIELKQWEQVKVTDRDGLVETFLGGGVRTTSHPSYQAWSYAEYLANFNSVVADDSIQLQPCAFVHNCTDGSALRDKRYQHYLEQAPVFLKQDTGVLKDFLRQFIAKGDQGQLMTRIDNGAIRPSKSLADSIVGLLKKQREFILLDEQKVVFETALAGMRGLVAAPQAAKQVLIVRGGPGTGKSVVAINLLVRALENGLNAVYVTKNAAPRDVYKEKLTGSAAPLTKARYASLFKGSGAFVNAQPDAFDALIVDEAHRLNEKGGLYGNVGENQILEVIRAARYSVFFLDEDQRIHIKDIGSEQAMRDWARHQGAQVQVLDLPSQFRCNGEDGYLAFVDQFLGIRESANTRVEDLDYEFQILDSPTALEQWVRAKNALTGKARMVAGYCWDWKSKRDHTAFDFDFPGFQKQWNLTQDGNLWIMNPASIDQIGCIHTCQGLECDYIGVLIGPDLIRDFATGGVTTNANARSKHDSSVKGWKSMAQADPAGTRALMDRLIKNTYRTLMTRGMKGCAICFVDAAGNPVPASAFYPQHPE